MNTVLPLKALDLEAAEQAARMLTDLDGVPADEAWLLMRKALRVSVATERKDPLGIATTSTMRFYVAVRGSALFSDRLSEKKGSPIPSNVISFETERRKRRKA